MKKLVEKSQRVIPIKASQIHRRRVPRVGPHESDRAEVLDIFNCVSEHVAFQNTENRVLWANEAARKFLGLTLQELRGRRCYEVWCKRCRPCVSCPAVKAHKTGQRQKGEIISRDGKIWLIQGDPVCDDNGHIIGVVVFKLETTSMRKSEANTRV